MGTEPSGEGRNRLEGMLSAPLGWARVPSGGWGARTDSAEASLAPGLGDAHPLHALPATTSSTRHQSPSFADDCFQLEELTMSCFQRVF